MFGIISKATYAHYVEIAEYSYVGSYKGPFPLSLYGQNMYKEAKVVNLYSCQHILGWGRDQSVFLATHH